MKKTSISDVAKLAQVSKSTVSQYLNGRYHYMSEETKHRIKQAINELNYQPNIIARSLKQKKSFTIGVVLSSILHAFSTKIIRSIEDYFQERGMHIILCNTDDDPKKERNYIVMLRAKQVDGLIVFPTGQNKDLYYDMIKESFPVVFIDRTVRDIQTDAVLLDNEKAAFTAIEHFVEHHHERIAIVGNASLHHITTRHERLLGYKKAMNHFGLPFNKKLVVETPLELLQRDVESLLTLKFPPTAILAINELSFLEVFHYIKSANIKVPNDVSIISIDDIANADILTPSITTVSQPAYEMGEKAAQLLYRKIINEEETINPSTFRFPPKLIVRESSVSKGTDCEEASF